jgi:hypothetical protein
MRCGPNGKFVKKTQQVYPLSDATVRVLASKIPEKWKM